MLCSCPGIRRVGRCGSTTVPVPPLEQCHAAHADQQYTGRGDDPDHHLSLLSVLAGPRGRSMDKRRRRRKRIQRRRGRHRSAVPVRIRRALHRPYGIPCSRSRPSRQANAIMRRRGPPGFRRSASLAVGDAHRNARPRRARMTAGVLRRPAIGAGRSWITQASVPVDPDRTAGRRAVDFARVRRRCLAVARPCGEEIACRELRTRPASPSPRRTAGALRPTHLWRMVRHPAPTTTRRRVDGPGGGAPRGGRRRR